MSFGPEARLIPSYSFYVNNEAWSNSEEGGVQFICSLADAGSHSEESMDGIAQQIMDMFAAGGFDVAVGTKVTQVSADITPTT